MTDKVQKLANEIKSLPIKEKVLVTAIIDELNTSTDTTNMIQTIKDYERDINITTNQIKTANNIITDHVEKLGEWFELEAAKEAVDRARTALNQKLMGDADHNNRLEELAQLKTKKKEQQSILSDFIVAYYGMTQERQIQTEDNGDAREVLLTGKLGKKAKYQTNLFSGVKSESI